MGSFPVVNFVDSGTRRRRFQPAPRSSQQEAGPSGGGSSVPRNQAGPSDVAELQHKHDDTLETNTSAVGRAAPLETVQVVGHCLGVEFDSSSSRGRCHGYVDYQKEPLHHG